MTTTMTRQEVFTKVVMHLREQKVQSGEMDEDGLWVCKYRGPNNTKCAAGCLIADEHYDNAMENRDCFVDSIERALVASGVSKSDMQLVRELQILHDTREPESWKTAFIKMADHFGLEVPQ